ncbi:hypothetical protein GC163_08875 [bacterium]|nr:hypothetical protein [bacterium]
MTNLFQQLSDDQLAIIGCVGALLCSGLLMQLCYTFGPQKPHNRQDSAPEISKLPQPLRHAEDRAA